ncbi:ABC transporter ATP-binding protein [Serratia microhaemolytica]|uniref:ABC transporter ATP-binding protein n=1 Tax=Serratia microhaemolytica TaxID=2675110 RepID=UPI000FDCE1C4|nr:ABC transporter ATP-binding protein [Serratia microhaemolytica]
MSSKFAIKIEGVSKCYQIYDRPYDRLKQFLLPPMQRRFGLAPNQYYREFWALNGVTFDVKKGEAVGIIGRNGSGKSTLLQIITGTLTPTSGTVTTCGRIAALLELGSGFNPEFTGRENVYLNGALLGFSTEQINEKFDSIAAFADIGEHLDQPVKTYSSGMLVRLAFAVQVQVEPDILIVDEALAVGDALFQKRCFQRIEKLTSNGTTLLFVSHDQESVRTLTSRALLLNKGNVLEWGVSSEVVLKYRKFLHNEEAAYILNLAKNTAEQVRVNDGTSQKIDSLNQQVDDENSFGDFEAYIKQVEIFVNGESSIGVVHPGDEVKISIVYHFVKALTHLSFGIRLRNKEGVKVYSGSTLAEDIVRVQSDSTKHGVWHRTFSAGEDLVVDMCFECRLGEGFYEIQAFVCEEAMLMPGYQRMLHWKDEAAFFSVTMDKFTCWYGGVCDICVNYSFSDEES